MNQIELHYVAHVTALTHSLKEVLATQAGTLRDLIDELDERYSGFREMFVDEGTRQLKLNVMIYYSDVLQHPVAVVDLDRPVRDHAIVTFW